MRDRFCAFAAPALAVVLAALLQCSLPADCHGRSAFSSRHTGIEPPGGPRSVDGPSSLGMRPARTADGGMGYTDAYGNTLEDLPPEEKKVRKRVHPGAYGHHDAGRTSGGLPDPDQRAGAPAWTFR